MNEERFSPSEVLMDLMSPMALGFWSCLNYKSQEILSMHSFCNIHEILPQTVSLCVLNLKL